MSTERTPFVTDAELKQQASAYTQPYATEIGPQVVAVALHGPQPAVLRRAFSGIQANRP